MSLFRDIVSEQTVFRGKPPNVPIASHINREELTAGDDDPFFVTLRIGEVGSTSGNKNYYDEAIIREVERQAVGLDSNMGHVNSSEADTAFPMPAGHWVGTKLVDGVLYGKLYVPRTRQDVREFFRVKMAQNGKVSTSIYSVAEREYDAQLSAYRLKNITLETIDLAPIVRNGVASLAAVPHITSEMESSEEEKTMGDQTQVVNKYTIISEMDVKDAGYLPNPVRDDIINRSQPAQLVSEMSTKLGVDADGVMSRVAELLDIESKYQVVVTEQINRTIEDEVASLVMPDVTQVTGGVKAVREMVTNQVKAQSLKDASAVKSAVADVAAQPMVQEMAKLALSAMGKHESGGSRGEGKSTGATNQYMEPKPGSEGESK